MSLNGCCDETDTSAIHPMTRVGRYVQSVLLPHLSDPIPKEIEDSEEIRKFFETYKFVPYAGTTQASGHGLLKFYIKLYNLSTTHGSVIEKLIKYCFSGAAIFERAKDSEYDTRDEIQPLTPDESKGYYQALKSTVTFDRGILEFHQESLRSLKQIGDTWVELSIAETEGITKTFLRLHRPEKVLYWNTAPGEARAVAISPLWTPEYIKLHPPRTVPEYPIFSEENGVKRTMFHLKNGSNSWYGKPDSQMADLYKYREAQDALYIIKEAANGFSGKTLLEVEGVSEDDERQAKQMGFVGGFAERVKAQYSMQGQADALMVMSRPAGSAPVFVKQFLPNTNQDWYKVTGDINAEKILIAHNATKRFMSFEQANGLSTNPFFDDYITNMAPVIGELRETVTNFTNKILNVIWDIVGQEEMKNYSINFRSPIDKALELYTNSLGNVTNNSAGGSTL